LGKKEETFHVEQDAEEVEWELDPALVERFAKTEERREKRKRDRLKAEKKAKTKEKKLKAKTSN
jgi:hypothetical protein